MKKQNFVVSIGLLILITCLFFYKTIIFGQIPFPGDLLISEYNPWKTYSYLGYNPGSVPTKVQYFDAIRQLYPWKTVVIDAIKHGEAPLWNPYNFAGSPLLANGQSAVFYPLNLFYLILPQAMAWTLLIVLQPLLATIFMFFFAKEIGMSRLGSILASISFGYSLFMTVFLEYNTIGHVILWLPLALYGVERMLKKLRFQSVLILMASLVFSFFGGHLQMFGFMFLFTILYTVFRLGSLQWEKRRKIWFSASFAALFALILGTCAIQLFPTLELISLSARVPQEHAFLMQKLLLQPQELILFVSPDFFGNPATRNYLLSDSYPGNAVYIGLVGLIFSFLALFNLRQNFFIRYFAWAALILLLLFIRSPFTELFYKFEVPLFSTGSPTNAIFLLSFALSILAGFGIELWLKSERRQFSAVPLLVLTAIFVLLWLFIVFTNPQVSIKNFLYSTLLMLAFISIMGALRFAPIKRTIVAMLFIALTAFDLFYFSQKFNPFVPKELVFPHAEIFTFLQEKARYYRFWGYGAGAIEANFGTQYLLFSPDGYDPLYTRRFGEFIQASKEGKIATKFTNQTRSDAKIEPGFGEEDLSSNFYRLRVLDTLGVRYILDRIENAATEKTFPQDRFSLIYEKDGWRIFENKKAAPRAFLTSDYHVFKGNEDFDRKFFAEEFDPTKMVLLEEDIGGLLQDNRGGDRVELLSYSAQTIILKTIASSKRILFLSDAYYPGWKAFVDKEETKIYRANYAFRLIVVPTGAHTVEFIYKPPSFSLGIKTTIISVALLLAVVLWLTKKAKLYGE